nr:hypothetical protein [Tanacetum cinerariifolium]
MFTLDDMCPLSRITSSKVLPVEHSSSVSTSVDVVVSSRFTEMPVTSYKRKARKAPDVSVRCSHHDDVCSYQFRPRSSDNKKSGVHIMMMSVYISSGLVLQTTRKVSQGRTIADSYAETSKDQEYFIMNLEHTQKRDPAVNIDWWLHARMVVLDHFMPFIDQFREGVYNFPDILTKEINEFERLFDDLDAEYK